MLLAAVLPKIDKLPRGSARLKLLGERIQTISPDLQNYGLLGMRPRAGESFVSWATFAQDSSERAIKAQDVERKLAASP